MSGTSVSPKGQFKRWLFSPPRPHGAVIKDRTVSNLELFYDLAYVAVIAQASHQVAEEPSVARGLFSRPAAAGAIVVQEPYDLEGGGEAMSIATLADPDDNYFQLMSPMNLGGEGGG